MPKRTFQKLRITIAVLSTILLCLSASTESAAQEQAAPPQETAENTIENLDDSEKSDETKGLILYKKQDIKPASIPSLLFTKWEYDTIRDAIKAIGNADIRLPTAAELSKSESDIDEARYKEPPPPEERYLTLSGLVYRGKGDWTLWLNGERVTPDAIPEEIVDLRVYKDYIEVKWFDDYSRSVFPVKLRPNQRFNLDTRIFLPG